MQELIIEEDNNLIKLIILEDNKIVEFYEYDKDNMPKIGNIYRAKVKDINSKTGSVFVCFDENKIGYIDIIKENVRVNDEILVMLKKEATLSKDAKMTTDITLAGKYIVLIPNSDIRTISRKLEEKNEIINEINKIIPNDFGYILRSESSFASLDDIIEETNSLIKKWEEIKKDDSNSLLYNANVIDEIIVREFVNKSTKKIYINSEDIYNKIDSKVSIEIDFDKDTSFLKKFGLITQMEDIGKSKIWLKSSGFINIDFTEALTAIDVNSGKYLGNSGFDKEDFSYKVNEEAAYEVMRQLRLKNIGGIIIVDFINMRNTENKEKIVEIMKNEAKRDRSKVEVYGFTNLGLVEIARKKAWIWASKKALKSQKKLDF